MAEDRIERVRRRAYDHWEKEGRPEGRASEHWLRAERELRDEEMRARLASAVVQEHLPDSVEITTGAEPPHVGRTEGP